MLLKLLLTKFYYFWLEISGWQRIFLGVDTLPGFFGEKLKKIRPSWNFVYSNDFIKRKKYQNLSNFYRLVCEIIEVDPQNFGNFKTFGAVLYYFNVLKCKSEIKFWNFSFLKDLNWNKQVSELTNGSKINLEHLRVSNFHFPSPSFMYLTFQRFSFY